MNYEVYLRTRRLDLDLDLAPPFLRFVLEDDAGAADAGAADAADADAGPDELSLLRSAFISHGAAAADAADAGPADADAGARFLPMAGSTSDADATGATSNERLPLIGLALAADAFADTAASFLSAVACLAAAFLAPRLASSARRFSSAASAACCFAVAAADAAAAAPNISRSNANLAAGSSDSHSNGGHSNGGHSNGRRASLVCWYGHK